MTLDTAVRLPDLPALARYAAVAALHQAYAACLDHGEIERWPAFFTADGHYRAQGRDNYDRGLPLSTLSCDGQGMLADRVTVISKIMVYAPRTLRHVIASPEILEDHGDWLRARASYCVFHTLPHEPTSLLSVGRYEDRIAIDSAGQLRFLERLAIYDSLLIPNSLVYPL